MKVYYGRARRKFVKNTLTCTAAPLQSQLWREWSPEGTHYGSHSCNTPTQFLPEDHLYAGSPLLTWLSPGGSQYGCESRYIRHNIYAHLLTCLRGCIKQKWYSILPARCVPTAITEPFLACVTVNHTSWIMNSTITKIQKVRIKMKSCSIIN